MTGLTIPDLPDDVDTLTAALAYANCGWYILPVKRGTKHPGSVVGDGWQHQSSRDPHVTTAWFAGTNYGTALHCGRSGAVVFDVDTPDRLPALLAEHLPAAPYQSTRPDQPGRGHYVFAQPPGRNIGNSVGRLGGGWGEVRGANGVIIVEPSHHKDGGEYRWETVGAVPVLPNELADELAEASPAVDAASDAVIEAFIAEHQNETRPNVLAGLVTALRANFDAGESRHQSTAAALVGAMKEAGVGLYTPRRVIDTIWPMFLEAVTKPPASGKQGTPRSPAAARSEFKAITAWAVGQALAANPDGIQARIDDKMPDLTNDENLFDGDPIPLSSPIAVPKFPIGALPEPYRDMVAAVAETTQTDPAMAGTSALSVISVCTGGNARLLVRPGWV